MPHGELERKIYNLESDLSSQELTSFLQKCQQLKWIESTSQDCWLMTGRGKVCFENYQNRPQPNPKRVELRAQYNAQPTAKTIIPIGSDGNCFWRCISMQLTGAETLHFVFRFIFQEFVINNSQIIKPFYSALCDVTDTSENIASNLWMFISLKIGLSHDPFDPVSIDQFYLLNNNIPTRNVHDAT